MEKDSYKTIWQRVFRLEKIMKANDSNLCKVINTMDEINSLPKEQKDALQKQTIIEIGSKYEAFYIRRLKLFKAYTETMFKADKVALALASTSNGNFVFNLN